MPSVFLSFLSGSGSSFPSEVPGVFPLFRLPRLGRDLTDRPTGRSFWVPLSFVAVRSGSDRFGVRCRTLVLSFSNLPTDLPTQSLRDGPPLVRPRDVSTNRPTCVVPFVFLLMFLEQIAHPLTSMHSGAGGILIRLVSSPSFRN